MKSEKEIKETIDEIHNEAKNSLMVKLGDTIEYETAISMLQWVIDEAYPMKVSELKEEWQKEEDDGGDDDNGN